MKFQKSVDLGGIYFAKVELTLKFDQMKRIDNGWEIFIYNKL